MSGKICNFAAELEKVICDVEFVSDILFAIHG
jgi:hypothetical protein